jgi:hypothetical protein
MKEFFDSKMLIFLVSVVFFAGSGWMSLQASTNELAVIEDRLDRMSEQEQSKSAHDYDGLKPQVEAMQDRLARLEQAVDKLKENQQQMAFNLGAVCAATGAKCQ